MRCNALSLDTPGPVTSALIDGKESMDRIIGAGKEKKAIDYGCYMAE